MIKSGDRIIVDYRLRINDGTEYANTKIQGEPLEFVAGSHAVLPDFEAAIIDMEVGESRSIHVPADRAYGFRDESLVVTVAPTALPNGDPLPAGSIIGLDTPEGLMRVKVLAVDSERVILDCNHELAGESLDFDITLLDVITDSAIEREQHSVDCACGCNRLQEAIG